MVRHCNSDRNWAALAGTWDLDTRDLDSLVVGVVGIALAAAAGLHCSRNRLRHFSEPLRWIGGADRVTARWCAMPVKEWEVWPRERPIEFRDLERTLQEQEALRRCAG